MLRDNVSILLVLCTAAVASICYPADAATVNGTATVTISSSGSVGATVVEPVVETPVVVVPAPGTSVDGVVTTGPGGDVVSVVTSTFRELPTPPAAETTVTPTTSTGNSTNSENVAQRFSAGTQSAAAVFGGASSVSVSGTPNQTFNITLPGQATFSTGSETISVSGFSHDAGATPQLTPSGTTTFNVGAQLNDGDAGAAVQDGGDGEDNDDAGVEQPTPSEPVATRSPYVGVTVSYN